MKKNKGESSGDGLLKAEAKIQQEIVMYYRNAFCLKHHSPRCMIFSIPNEGRGAASMQLLATGLYPGCADLCIIVPTWDSLGPRLSTIFIECKAADGVQSDKQKAFQEHCESMGIRYYIVRSLDEFKQFIENL